MTSDLHSTSHIGPWRLVRELGRGGMGVVYEGLRESGPGRDRVAIKVILDGADADARPRFLREAKALSRIRHPGLVAIRDLGEVDGCPYIVMDFVAGESLDDVLGRRPDRRLPPESIVPLAIGVSDALGACHRAHMIHRDVKPTNIIVRSDSGRPVLVDFGLARHAGERSTSGASLSLGTLTATGEVLGSPTTMAPEQFDPVEFGPPGPASDVWGLAATLYIALCGRCPFEGRSAIQIFTRIERGPPEPPSKLEPEVPEWLSELLLEGLRVQPDERPGMEEFHNRLLAGPKVRAARAGASGLLMRALIPSLLLIVVLLAGVLGLLLLPAATPAELIAALGDAAARPAAAEQLRTRLPELKPAMIAALEDRLRSTGELGGDDAGRLVAALVRLQTEQNQGIAPDACLELRPLNADALQALSRTLMRVDHRQTLAELIRLGLHQPLPKPERALWEARSLELAGQPARALEALEAQLTASATSPQSADSVDSARVLAAAARLAFLYRRDARAEALLDRALKVPAPSPALASMRLRLLRRAGDEAGHRALIKRMSQARPSALWELEASIPQPLVLPLPASVRPPVSVDAVLEEVTEAWRRESLVASHRLADHEARRELVARRRLVRPADPELMVAEAMAILDAGRPAIAAARLEALKASLTSQEGLELVDLFRARCLKILGHDDEAKAIFERYQDRRLDGEAERMRRFAQAVIRPGTDAFADLQRAARASDADIDDRLAYVLEVVEASRNRSRAWLSKRRQGQPFEIREEDRIDFERCRRTIAELLDREPRLVRLRLAAAALERDALQFDAARAHARAALELNPGSADARLTAQMIRIYEVNDSERSLGLIEELARSQPEHPSTRFLQALYRSFAKRPPATLYEPARIGFQRFPGDPTVATLYYQGAAARSGLRFDDEVLRVLRSHRDHPQALARGVHALAVGLEPARRGGMSRAQLTEQVRELFKIARPLFAKGDSGRTHLSPTVTRSLIQLAREAKLDEQEAQALDHLLLFDSSEPEIRRFGALMFRLHRPHDAIDRLLTTAGKPVTAFSEAFRMARAYSLVSVALMASLELQNRRALNVRRRLLLVPLMVTAELYGDALKYSKALMPYFPTQRAANSIRLEALSSAGQIKASRARAMVCRLLHVDSASTDLHRLAAGGLDPDLAGRLRLAATLDDEVTEIASSMTMLIAGRGRLGMANRGLMLASRVLPERADLQALRYLALRGRDPITMTAIGPDRASAAGALLANCRAHNPEAPELETAALFGAVADALGRRDKAGSGPGQISGTTADRIAQLPDELKRRLGEHAERLPSDSLDRLRCLIFSGRAKEAATLLDRRRADQTRAEMAAESGGPGVRRKTLDADDAASDATGLPLGFELLSVMIQDSLVGDPAAVAELERVLQREPGHALAWLQLGQRLQSRDKPRSAQAFARALSVHPLLEPAIAGLSSLKDVPAAGRSVSLGASYARWGRPRDPELVALSIHGLLGSGRVKEARRIARMLQQLAPEHPALRDPRLRGDPRARDRRR